MKKKAEILGGGSVSYQVYEHLELEAQFLSCVVFLSWCVASHPSETKPLVSEGWESERGGR